MAAARQKEMNVSITEDATMSRTRSEGGATVVRVDAITDLPAFSAVQLSKERNIAVRPGLSVCLNEDSVNENPCLHPKTLWQKQLIVRTQPPLPLLASSKMHNDAPTPPWGEEDCAERLARKRTIRLMH